MMVALMKRVTRRLWVVVLSLSATLVFWGLLQNQVELNTYSLPSDDQDVPRVRRVTGTKHPATSVQPQQPWFKPIPGGTSPKLKTPTANRLFPILHEREDRIIQQINLIPSYQNYGDQSNDKLILLNNGFPDGVPNGNKKFHIDGCPVRNCFLTDDRTRHKEAHAIVHEGGMFHEPYKDVPPWQISIIYLLESPENVADLVGHINRYNWTATYRLDSTINAPYERFIPYANTSGELPQPKRNYAEGKQSKVAWFVSNCYTTNKRGEYASELQKYIDLDIFGSCGNKTCFRSERNRCNKMLNADYKFYLAFENSNCRDYITEKFYWNALYNDVVPIVMGARPQDYAKVSPPGSYIHVDDFESPQKLAEYLHKLDKNDTLYNEYFRWKGTGEFIDTKYWCRLCSMVHESYSNKSGTMWYSDIARWWNGPGVCIRPSGNQKWASWRDYDNSASDRIVTSKTVHYGRRPKQ